MSNITASQSPTRAWAGFKRLAGILMIAGGVMVGGLAAMLLPGAAGLLVAAAAGAVGVGLGALALRSASNSGIEASRRELTDRELSVIDLARHRGGALTVTETAEGLGISMAEADAALTAMADGSRVWAEVTPDGFMRYVFRELDASPGPRVRVADDTTRSPEEIEALEELERELAESTHDA